MPGNAVVVPGVIAIILTSIYSSLFNLHKYRLRRNEFGRAESSTLVFVLLLIDSTVLSTIVFSKRTAVASVHSQLGSFEFKHHSARLKSVLPQMRLKFYNGENKDNRQLYRLLTPFRPIVLIFKYERRRLFFESNPSLSRCKHASFYALFSVHCVCRSQQCVPTLRCVCRNGDTVAMVINTVVQAVKVVLATMVVQDRTEMVVREHSLDMVPITTVSGATLCRLRKRAMLMDFFSECWLYCLWDVALTLRHGCCSQRTSI